MLCTRNFLKIANFSQVQQAKLLNKPVNWASLHTSSWLSQQSKDQFGESEKIRVYYGSLTPNIKSVKVFSLSTSIAGLVAQPILYEKAAQLGSSTPVIVGICGFVGFFTFVTPFLIHLITKKYCTELYFDPATSEYTATIFNFFLVKKQIKFKVEDVHVPEVPGMFTSFIVNHKGSNPASLFVDPKLFDDPYHYVKIMGFDKPMDFKLNLPAEDDSKKK